MGEDPSRNRNATSLTSSVLPAAASMIKSYAWSLVKVKVQPLIPSMTIVAASARRLFPSTRAWFLQIDSKSAAAFERRGL